MNRTLTAAVRPAFFPFRSALLLVVALWGISSLPLHAQSGNTFYKRGQAAEAHQDFDAAFDDYQKALAKSPNDLRYQEALYRVRISAAGVHMSQGRKLLAAGDLQGALAEFLHAAEIDPTDEAAHQEIARIRMLQGQAAPSPSESNPELPSQREEIESMGGPVRLKPVSNEPLTLHMTEDSKNVYQAVGRAAGINVLFDPDYNSKRIQVDLNNVSLLDALRIVGTMSNTFWRPVTANTIFVAQNTRAKRTELEDQAVQTFYLTNAWQQNDLNDVQTALRNVLTNIKVYGVASQNALVVRGTPDELLLAQKLINDLDKARPEVVVDIAVMEVSKNWERTLGLQWPSSASVQLQSNSTTTNNNNNNNNNCATTGTCTGTNTPNLTLYNLAHLNSNDFAISVGAATANLLLNDNNTRILQNPRLRATDAQKATMKIGERIPIATGSYQTGAATALVSSLVNTQFQYIDVGVNIEITPTVHYDHDVTLKMKIDVTAQSGNVNISGVTEPIIAQKTTEEVVRLREGEANILSGILNQQEQESWSGIPGLSSIPILKYLFGSKDHTKTDDEVVFMMVPHIVRSEDLTPLNLRTIDTGVGQAIELRHIALQGRGANAPPEIHPVTGNSTVGTVPGHTAAGAAPAALTQMKETAPGSAMKTPVPQTNVAPPAPPPAPPPMSAPPPQPSPQAAGGPKVSFLMNPPGQVAAGSTFQVPIVISGAQDIDSTPMQIQYDASKLSLVNVGGGDFLSRDQQPVSLVHRDDGPGTITINASRPPGAPGVNGAGVVCVLSFEAKAAGDAKIEITRPGALTSKQQPVLAQGTSITVSVK
jgi:general secretion pathway protein D